MKNKKWLIGISIAAAIFVAGCATPIFTPATDNSPASTNYVPNATATQISAALNGAAPMIPPPYGTLLTAIAGLIAAGAGTIATYKNNQLNASLAASDTLAKTIVNAGPAVIAQAHANAASDDTSALVATHIANV